MARCFTNVIFLWLDMFELTFNRSYSNMCMIYVSSAIPKLPTHGFGGTVVVDQTLALSTNHKPQVLHLHHPPIIPNPQTPGHPRR